MPSAPPSNKTKIIFIGAAIVLIAALYYGWQFGNETAPPPAVEKVAEPKKSEVQPLAPKATDLANMPPATQLTTAEEGDVLIDEILRSDKEIPQMARDLHELVKKLNGEAQVNASRHLVNLTGDEDYGLIAGFLVDDKMNPDVIEVLFSDLMNRDRALQLPLFMNILKNPKHPQNEEVRNVLTILAGDDFGTDFTAWDKWASDELKTLQEQ
ncbi:hypothetical protein SAMN02745166_03719 [Prosthecobacter debontii]|uniref:Uncharacterized protein n=1 Tax=Prosthecobacter debontii TaxID=48467 RepID=A0A1T4YMK4_9BACT|nr:hypothetical protein [Prosthecobacter debontii]SKB02940.1 hypothetical protein SAMN02745166_03719 [Prosthecobacter debontii]